MNYKKFFINTCSFLLYLFPASLILSVFFANLIVAIISIFFLIYIILKKKTIILNNIFFKSFIIFWVFIVIRSFFAEDVSFSIRTSFFYIRYILFCFAIILIIENNKFFLKNFLNAFLFTLSILLLDAFIQFFFDINLIGVNTNSLEDGRISGLFGRELILGSFISKIIFLLLGILSLFKNKIYQYIFFPILLLSLMVILISGDRSAFFITILILIYLLVFSNTFNLRRKIIYFLTIAISLSLIIYTSDRVQTRIIKYTKYQLVNENSNTKNIVDKFNLFSKGHEAHYLAAYKMFKDNIIFGQGANMFRLLCSKNEFYNESQSCSTHPHNYYIQLLAETGLFGFIFLVTIFLYLIFNLFLKKFTNFGIYVSLSFILNIFPLMPTGNFFNSWVANVYFLSFAFYIYAIKKFK